MPVLGSLACAFAALASAGAEVPPTPGRLIEVGGHRLHLDCRGAGTPAVVFDAGLGGNSLDWTLVQPGVAVFTRACAYDRAGYGWSDPGPLPRDAEAVVADLERLLANGKVPPPYLLVGHSLGGLIVQRFARRNPRQIAGLVLIDAAHENQFKRLMPLVTPPAASRRSVVVAGIAQRVPAGLPEPQSGIAAAFMARAQAIVAARSELELLRHPGLPPPGPFPDVPLVVISHRISGESARNDGAAQAWMAMQSDLMTLTPQSRQVIAATADHYVHIREPATVITAIRELVEQNRAAVSRAAAAASR